MTKNVGTVDRAVRVLIGIAALATFFLGVFEGTLGTVALVAGIAMLGTAAIGWCGAYSLFGIKTCPVDRDSQSAA